jgi:hypothetical protein
LTCWIERILQTEPSDGQKFDMKSVETGDGNGERGESGRHCYGEGIKEFLEVLRELNNAKIENRHRSNWKEKFSRQRDGADNVWTCDLP